MGVHSFFCVSGLFFFLCILYNKRQMLPINRFCMAEKERFGMNPFIIIILLIVLAVILAVIFEIHRELHCFRDHTLQRAVKATERNSRRYEDLISE